jgi:5-formyltetrahydrofolate cyclo-ligase
MHHSLLVIELNVFKSLAVRSSMAHLHHGTACGGAVDLVVEGCVAVDLNGNRLGMDGGYGDREIRLEKQHCGDVPVVTTCHPVQLVAAVPVEEQDEWIEIIVTPERIY